MLRRREALGHVHRAGRAAPHGVPGGLPVIWQLPRDHARWIRKQEMALESRRIALIRRKVRALAKILEGIEELEQADRELAALDRSLGYAAVLPAPPRLRSCPASALSLAADRAHSRRGALVSNIPDTNEARRATIGQAVGLIDSAAPDDLARWLGQTGIAGRFKADPAGLREVLDDARQGGPLQAAWDAAKQLLDAAGQPH